MLEKPLDSSVLRFQVEIGGKEFQTVLNQLRGIDSTEGAVSRPTRRAIKALVDFDCLSGSYLISKIQNHQLPRALAIAPETETHHHLSSEITKEIYRQGNQNLVDQLQKIIDSCSHISSSSMRIRMGDLSVVAPHSKESEGLSPTPILATLAPSISLDFDDTPQIVIPREAPRNSSFELDTIAKNITLSCVPEVSVDKNTWNLTITFDISEVSLETNFEIYAHWGSYDELSTPWSDELLASIDKSQTGRIHELAFTGEALIRGRYGIAFFIGQQGNPERRWLSSVTNGDLCFSIRHDDIHSQQQRINDYKRAESAFRETIEDAIDNPKTLSTLVSDEISSHPSLSVGASLSDRLRNEENEEHSLQVLLGKLIASSDMNRHQAEQIKERILQTYGLGEIVFISPEGPHAGAGGLAQVMSGLPPTIARNDIPTTIISPLYAYANGNKHLSALEVLESGIVLGDLRVVPEYVGSVRVDLGPTYLVGTSAHKRSPSSLTCKVYLAQHGNLRLFLLANSSIFDRLYQPVYADEQLRRTIAFSRASLEVIAHESLLIKPSVIISNDWMTACVPSLCALDTRYSQIDWLRNVKTIHMIHNGGADYHGRLPLHFGDEDLWPMFNLPPEHYFGFRDPHRSDLLNLTMAATQHVSGGVLTVSQPYATDLLSDIGSDGLHYVLQHKKADVFGVSNGINRAHIDSYISLRTGNSLESSHSEENLLDTKMQLKKEIQLKYGLTANEEAQILCMVGRLAEQKGLDLLTGTVEGTNHSTLEDILIRHPKTQLIIAGPVTTGDESATHFCDTIRYLQTTYPGRVGVEFSYLAHASALDIIAGSSLFLMPSRFEPGGIAQLEALAVGTPVVGRGVGGISATVVNFDPTSELGTGFLCFDYNPTAFANTVHWAIQTCDNTHIYRSLIRQAYHADHSWEQRSAQFTAVLQTISLGDERASKLSCLETSRMLVSQSRAWKP